MSRLALLSTSMILLLGAAACGDDGGSGNGPGPDAGIDAPAGPVDDGDTGLGQAAGEVDPLGFAVINSDFSASTSLSLLDRDGKVVKGDCFTSGTKAPGVTTALSSDVVLPSWAQAGNEVMTIDRRNAVLTWLDPATCVPSRQLDVSTGFSANPHDVVSVAANKAYVLRSELNKAPGKVPFDAGDDLLIIDPSKPAITGRIDLAPFAVQVAGTKIQARPERARRIGDKLYVALSNLSADFATAAHGRIAIVDLATDTVSGTIDIPDLDNCSNLSYVTQSQTLIVACNGSFSAADQTAVSGIVSIDTTTNTVSKVQAAAPFGKLPVFTYAGIAKRGALGFAVTSGDFGGPRKDQLWRFDTAAASANSIASGGDGFVYGTVLIDPSKERVYLTDATASAPHLLVFAYTSTATTAQPSINTSPTAGLPPRELQWR
ncbi:MAG TPA: hypothetical protein VFP84_15870 [Kofleriaceae bacterium]|nr:hypothetical protein [Kofleriaceae bacterium]